jgi:RES domain-containing protein
MDSSTGPQAFRIGLGRAHTLIVQSDGSSLAPGRWHSLCLGASPRRVIDAANNRAVAQLEERVHANGIAPIHQAFHGLTLPAQLKIAHVQDLGRPADWRRSKSSSQAFSDRWWDAAQALALALWAQSSVQPTENNLLINVDYPALAQVTLVKERDPFGFDPRLA